MFGISGIEFLVIFVIALLAVGPKQLPDIMRFFGKLYRQGRVFFRKYRDFVDDALFDAERLAEKAEKMIADEEKKNGHE